MSSKDDMVVLFTKPYLKDFERSINAIERYQAIEQPLEYILFSTSVNEPCFDCSGYLPSVETIREISHFTRDGLSYEILFTISDSSFSWTMIFLFISKGPYFVWRAENQNSPDV